jgi:hypothetical protein
MAPQDPHQVQPGGFAQSLANFTISAFQRQMIIQHPRVSRSRSPCAKEFSRFRVQLDVVWKFGDGPPSNWLLERGRSVQSC